MHANNLRSPLALGLAAAVVAGAIALPLAAGHRALPGPRVVSDANIRLASCASGTSPGPLFGIMCYSVSNQWDGTYNSEEIQLTFTIYGPLGGVSTLFIHEYYSLGDLSVTGSFTGPFRGALAGIAVPVARPTRRGAVTGSSGLAEAPRTAVTASAKGVASDKTAKTPRSAAVRSRATSSHAGAANAPAARTTVNRRAANTTA